MFDKFNLYDLILVVLGALLIFGELGNGAQPVRLFIIAVSPFLFVDLIRSSHASLHYYRYECVFFIFWWLFALSFLYKAESLTESVKHLVYLFLNILGFFEIIWAALKARNPQGSLIQGWILLLLASFPIAFYELYYDIHLPTSVQDSGAYLIFHGVAVERRFASVTFGNLNAYNTILCWALPFLFSLILFPRKKIDSMLGFVVLFIMIFIVAANSSRGAFLCYGTVFVIYLYCYMKIGAHKILLMLFLSICLSVFVYNFIDIFLMIYERFDVQGMEDDGRTENIIKGIVALYDSGFLGIGIGNYEAIMGRVYDVAKTAPHNLLLEIAVIYGIFVFIGFCLVLLRLFIIAKRGPQYNWFMFLLFATCFLFAGIVDSNYIMKVSTWVYFGSFYVFVDKRFNCIEQ